MLTAVTISHVWVLDQDQALDFYVNKLGLEVCTDMNLGFMRWLTVGVPGDASRQILLELPAPPSVDSQAADQIRELVSKGATGFTVGFATDNCQQTYETLVARGVEITQEPTERFYGIDIGVRDPFGNHIRVTESR
ncbi:MAG: VOC family protein [Chloroflexi bacterium]|nr:VOC family protein [Chloroflexota bacterium]